MDEVPPIGTRVRINKRVPNPSWVGEIVTVVDHDGPYEGHGLAESPDAPLTLPNMVVLEAYYLEPLCATPEEVEAAREGLSRLLSEYAD